LTKEKNVVMINLEDIFFTVLFFFVFFFYSDVETGLYILLMKRCFSLPCLNLNEYEHIFLDL